LLARLGHSTTGKELYDWAMELEADVCRAIDSFDPAALKRVPGHDSIFGFMFLTPSSLFIDDAPVAQHFLLMLDDVHKLTRAQRQRLLERLVDIRSQNGIWLAERFEALSTDEMLSSGAVEGRDYGGILALENLWRERHRRFENLAFNIADRRARSAADVEIAGFSACIQSPPDGGASSDLSGAFDIVANRVKRLGNSNPRFQPWLSAQESADGGLRDRLLAWRSLEILMERERRRTQRSFEFPLGPDIPDVDSDVRSAAELFLAREHGFPYYFGPPRLVDLASSNIEQFLMLAGNEFEEIGSSVILKRAPQLSPIRQEAIVLAAGKALWDQIPRRVRHGRQVQNFLEQVGHFAAWMTYSPTASYAPGVTGIAISMADREVLRQSYKDSPGGPRRTLAEVIASALAHNLLDATLDYHCKGKRWMVLNLNRLLCAHFRLPLQYGGWKERTIRDLVQWLDSGFRPPKQTELAPHE
jgi:hypothetical protein